MVCFLLRVEAVCSAVACIFGDANYALFWAGLAADQGFVNLAGPAHPHKAMTRRCVGQGGNSALLLAEIPFNFSILQETMCYYCNFEELLMLRCVVGIWPSNK